MKYFGIRATIGWLTLLSASINAHANDYSVAVLNEALVFPGTTLLTDLSNFHRQAIVEVDMKGKVVWRHEPFIPSKSFLLDATYLNNDRILYTVKGYGIFEIDQSGKVHWQHKDSGVSHDADRLANGNTLYNRSWVSKGEDVVREISSSGEIVWSWRGLEAFDKPPFNSVSDEGWMHVNSVSRLASGNTLISIRNFNTIVEISQSGDVVRSWTFKSDSRRTTPTPGIITGERNHEPEMLDNGNILVALRNPFRYVEFNPTSQEIAWQWQPPEDGFLLRFNREANRLPNGNTLVTTGNQIVEVTQSGEVVWKLNGAYRTSVGDLRVFHKAIRRGLDGKIYGD